MGKTLVVTDIHLNNPRPGYLDAQLRCLWKIYDEERPHDLIIMGDVLMQRRPTPTVLLGLNRLLSGFDCHVWLLRGNHDSETKADDGVTALSLFESDKVKVITHTKTFGEWTFIPHYENERVIKEALAEVPEGNTVFGHFGYTGCLNSTGDYDFNITLSEFTNRTLLGHIHKFNHKPAHSFDGLEAGVTILGTPYSINFGDFGKENFYAVKNFDSDWEFKRVEHGIRHLVFPVEEVPEHLEEINDPNYFTHLRILVDKLGEENSQTLVDDVKEMCDVAQVDIKFRPLFSESDTANSFNPDRSLFSINEAIIEEYVSSSDTTIPKEDLMEGYRFLDED